MPEAPTLSVIVITLNEEANLPRCLASVQGLAPEIVVVDSGSSDRTREIAVAAGARLVVQPFLGHVRQKQLALDHATAEWVLSLDADEWLDEELRAAVAGTLASGPPDEVSGYLVRREPFYLGRWIRASGWNPEWKLRLARRKLARFEGSDPHDRLDVSGKVRRLPGVLCHFPFVDLADHVETQCRYAAIAAAGRKPVSTVRAVLRLTLKPALIFCQKLFVQRGYLDGVRGVIIAATTAFYFFLREALLWERAHAPWQEPD
jgi:glycosyltransferase involved in cell wall biosynthesis